ncbi:helix-turn-helix transcriptional regulator [Roseivirga sp. BDSF3-8]|uniref:helix-turn-helix transcriptional regulator n=1 Tax=Roseivirga sp. BDSF3-8 TaxID=3241598 RepID=UPI0035327BDF
MERLQENIRILRKRNALKQEDVAGYLGITRAAYGMYETGSRDVPHEKQVLIAKFYDIPLHELQAGRIEKNVRSAGANPGVASLQSDELMQLNKMDLVSHCLALQKELDVARSRNQRLEQDREEIKRVLRGLMER